MPEITEADVRTLPPAQAAELSLVVELEARWENMRKTPARAEGMAPSDLQTLRAVQIAYDAFHSKLVAYNRKYAPTHVPELLLNTPARLALWCRLMRDLYRQVEHDPQTPCPVQLLAKAYRWAGRLSARLNKHAPTESAPPQTVRAAIGELEALVRWCDGLAAGAAGA